MYGVGELMQENLAASAPERAAFMFIDIYVACMRE